jgi:hypothetical protein
MSIVMAVGPIMTLIAQLLSQRSSEVAKQTGLSEDAVGKVGQAMAEYLSKDERTAQQVMAEIEKARGHDVATSSEDSPPIVQLMRGLVRPVITLTAFFWYVVARLQGIVLGAEDYAIIGGIMAFWFGFRPFEKAPGGLVPPLSGRGK